jgi:hypothetical protein
MRAKNIRNARVQNKKGRSMSGLGILFFRRNANLLIGAVVFPNVVAFS